MNTIALILNLLPAFIAAIKALEEAIPGEGKGEMKLNALRGILELADDNAKKLPIDKIVGVIVSLMNAAGGFKK